MNTIHDNSENATQLRDQNSSSAKADKPRWEQFFTDLGDLVITLGRATIKAAEDATGMMVIPVTQEDKYDLDVFIEAGIAKSRSEVALKMMRDGFRSNEKIYRKIAETKKQIAELRNHLRALI